MIRVRARDIGSAVAVVSLIGLGVAPTAAAGDGTFRLVQCDPAHPSANEAVREGTAAYVVRLGCSDSGSNRGVRIDSVDRAAKNRAGRVRWVAPAGMSIIGVQLDAKLRRDGPHRSRLLVAGPGDARKEVFARGGPSPTAWKTYRWTGSAAREFVAELVCDSKDGCKQSGTAKTWVRDVWITVADHEPPTISVSGGLLEPGWKRGEGQVDLSASDLASGVSGFRVGLRGAPVYSDEVTCAGALSQGQSRSWTPCWQMTARDVSVDTRRLPFVDGSNSTRLCAVDFAGNEACVQRTVQVDNTGPVVRFFPDLYAPDPELIRASAADQHSGLFAGSIAVRPVGQDEWGSLATQIRNDMLEARVDSSSVPPGEYEFIAHASDVAGNTTTTSLRSDGEPMILSFPLRDGVQLRAHLEPGGAERKTVPYGRRARVEGTLTSATGEPLAGRRIVVDENFGLGALIDHRVRTVVTDAQGHWRSRLPVGPSRRISVRFDGDLTHVPSEVSAGRLNVRTGVRLRVSSRKVREGRAVTFKGKVGRVGARIPAPGKLVQLQYQEPVTRRWYTVRNPFYTDSRGRFMTRYRFGTHYSSNVKIRFRMRAFPERDWPYRAARSAVRRITVVAR